MATKKAKRPAQSDVEGVLKKYEKLLNSLSLLPDFSQVADAEMALENISEAEDEDDITDAFNDLELDDFIDELEGDLRTLKEARGLIQANAERIKNHFTNQLVECPHCNHKFNKDMV